MRKALCILFMFLVCAASARGVRGGSSGSDSVYLVVALRQEVRAAIDPHRLQPLRHMERQANEDLQRLAAMKPEMLPLFNQADDDDTAAAQSLPDETLDRWQLVRLPAGADPEKYLESLRALSIVEDAYRKPTAFPASFGGGRANSEATPDMHEKQGYLNAAPLGIDAHFAWEQPGGDGRGIVIADIEGDWNKKHEDLRLERKIINGERAGRRSSWFDHGTAVAGIVDGRNNHSGITGIAWGARMLLFSIFRTVSGDSLTDNVADAIYQAARRLKKGDIILLEVQYSGLKHSNEYIPVEYYPDVFEAIRYATGRGLIVVEAAGNGGQDLDDPQYGNRFDTAVRGDSGAIIVGAGTVIFGRSGAPLANDRKRLWFSNFGRRVDVQNWGERVVTSGYGDLLYSGRNRNYTSFFNGTSSATAITAGACAALQGAALESIGRALTPFELRELLVSTGTPQQGSEHNRNIGPRPNLRCAIRKLPHFKDKVGS